MIVTLAELLKKDLRGKTVVFPTDTVYGLGCLLNDIEATKKIYQIKQRDGQKPLAVLVSSYKDALGLIEENPIFIELAKKYWPGALTLIAKKTDLVMPEAVSNGLTVGIRQPNHPVALEILSHFGPMTTTSLNLSTQPAILQFHEVLSYLDQVDYIIDGGNLSSPSSTVYDTMSMKVLRQGDIVIEGM